MRIGVFLVSRLVALGTALSACGHAPTQPASGERGAVVIPAPSAEPADSSDERVPDREVPFSAFASRRICSEHPKHADMIEAGQLFKIGVTAYSSGDYAPALSAFEKAYGMSCKALILYNIGRVLELQGDIPGAIATYQQYVQDAPADAETHHVKEHIEELKKR